MQTRGIIYQATAVVAVAALALSGCTSGSDDKPVAASAPEARAVDFDVPTSPQAAEKAIPPGDRTKQELWDVATDGKRLVAVGRDESFNVTRPLILSSDDAGATWTRRQVTADSLSRSSVKELPGLVEAGPGGFVAVGPAIDGPVVWTSADGTDWTRQPTDRKIFQSGDAIDHSAVTPQGYVLVGAGGSPSQAIVWRSRDGVSWQRTAGPGIGLKTQVPGSVSITDVAANGNVVVVSAVLHTSADPKISERLQFWRSADGGASFTRAAVTGDIASDYRVYPNAVGFFEGKWYALIQGGGEDPDRDTGWDGVVMEGGAAGTSWRVIAHPLALGSGNEESPRALHRVGKDWVVVSQVTADTEQATIVVGAGWNEMTESNDPSQVGPGDQLPHGSTVIGSNVVVVGSTDVSGTSEAAIWRYGEGKTTAVTLPAEASGGRASAVVKTVVQAGKDLVAVGDIAEAPMAWSRTPDGWPAVALPGRKADSTPGLVDATVAPDGRAVAVGYKATTLGRGAALWLRAADGRWSEVSSPAFGQVNPEYGGPFPNSIAIGPKRWVMVGESFDADGHNDAWVVHSADGKTWQDARGDRSQPVGRGSAKKRTPWRNFRAPGATGDAEMNTVIADRTGFVAGGYFDDGRTSTAAVWLSPDGASWPTRVSLPTPSGFSSAEVSSVRRVGTTLTATGPIAKAADDPDAGWATWSSTDNGRTWRAGTSPAPKQAKISSVLPVPGGLVAFGATGPLDSTDAAAWFSSDGTSWRPLELSGDRVKGPGTQSLVSAVVQDDKLLVVGSDIPPAGGGYYTLELPLPK